VKIVYISISSNYHRQLFTGQKSGGFLYKHWREEVVHLFTRFTKSGKTPENIQTFYNLNFSPIALFEFYNKQPPSLGKNLGRIYTMRDFGKRLVEACNYRGYSQSGLARILDISQVEISQYQRGKFTPRSIIRQRLAYELKVNYFWLSWNAGEKEYYDNFPVEQFEMTMPERIIYQTWKNELTLKDIQERLEVSNSAVQMWMEGKRTPTRKNLQILADLLQVSVDYLNYGTELPRLSKLEMLKINHQILRR